MAELRLAQIAEKMEGQVLQGDPGLIFQRYNFDSRLTEPGELFFAIVAERNGHDFVREAYEKGASGAVISEDVYVPSDHFALIRVEDTVEALQNLAKKMLADYPVKVVGITGSVGKTTTKEFTAILLSSKFRVLKSEKNFNNCLGLALTLVRLSPDHGVAVLEMAMSAPGEIRALTRIAPPDVSLITNINPVHLRFFPSLEEIALAKKEILNGTKAGGTAVLNGDDPLVRKIAKDWKGKKITFGLSAECDIQAISVQKMGYEGMSFELRWGKTFKKIHFPFLYESYVLNLLAAMGAVQALGLRYEEIESSLNSLKPFPGRGGLIRLAGKMKLIDDSYNSNPKALESALKALADLPAGRRVAVLGDMLELGPQEIEFHYQVGQEVAQARWDLLITIGPLSRHMARGAVQAGMKPGQVFSFPNSEEAADKIEQLLQDDDLILVKGSRAMKTEKIVERLKETFREV